MAITKNKFTTNTWVAATWDEYIQETEKPEYEKAKTYYYQEKLRIEMIALGNDHASDHYIIGLVVAIFAGLKHIPLNGKDNCSYRKTGYQEAQPDLSFYIGENAAVIPWGTKAINLDNYPVPNLVVEVGDTSLSDDLGQKRILYEDLQVQEYWVVDVQNVQVIAFTIENEGSRRIPVSQVLPGLNISVLTEALQRSRQTHHSEITAWLLQLFQ